MRDRPSVWIVIVAIAGCDRSVAQPTCTHACAVGETRCEPDGRVARCVEPPSADGCRAWSDPEPCLSGRTCVEAACLCLDPCGPGHTVCASQTSEHRCVGPDDDGCFVWGPPESCDAGRLCEGGACDCGECGPGETACHPQTGGLLTCVGPDGDGCTSWSETDCEEHRACVGGACVGAADCEPCDARCEADSVVACAGPDPGGCMYWEDPVACEPGMECKPDVGPALTARCVAPTPPLCEGIDECDFVGQKVCMDATRYRECTINPDDGCLKLDCAS